MTCLKLFSGDLPELINEVIQYFHYDYKTLHSCILVNRLWCRLAIPLLWEDPFSFKVPKNYHFIEIYLYNLSDDDKTKLNEYATLNNLLPSNTLFNYHSFIQRLNTHTVYDFVRNWVTTVTTSTTEGNTDLTYTQMRDFTKLIYKSLFLVFIENEVNLYSFEVVFHSIYSIDELEYFDGIFELILRNLNFISNIKNFILDFDEATDTIQKFVRFLYSNCNSISSLYFLLPTYGNYPLIDEDLSQIVKSQKNLKKISFSNNNFPLYKSLLLLNNPDCSNTLSTIIFDGVDFYNIVVLSEVFNQLNVLESIHIIYCYSLDSKFFQQIDNVTKPFKLRTLFLYKFNKILEPLLQRTGIYLENLGIIDNESRQLQQLITKYCSNIKYLYPMWFDKENTYLLFNLIEDIKQNLNYISINYYYFESSNVLQNLGQVLPLKLEYLNLSFTINTNDLEVFLKNSQNVFIKKFLIRNSKRKESRDIFPYIKEYIMKNKRVKYLAIEESFDGKIEELFSQKDKVKEFELHGIRVQNYNDLFINIYKFIKETY
ncbi:hypothetical protein RclHR1_04740002 [Rhizophagus clarus]|uniref:F-box domain-containing protein n=1 Tax=Rhizophagus clarus TaxID=94130 RepID=A0A2Z6SD14_9GLOM|nr:hypothetical protein RclHR1_04740002 [Rhizophagus clarus]GES79289.1 hypothetical protein GLOIN_2v1784886 [Rhizophagus clarus]